MHRIWQVQAGHLLCVWSEFAQHVGYSARWMKEASDADVPSGYLPPVPDFTSHSPFCGAFWFQPHPVDRDSE
jgi:hypothetical protein